MGEHLLECATQVADECRFPALEGADDVNEVCSTLRKMSVNEPGCFDRHEARHGPLGGKAVVEDEVVANIRIVGRPQLKEVSRVADEAAQAACTVALLGELFDSIKVEVTSCDVNDKGVRLDDVHAHIVEVTEKVFWVGVSTASEHEDGCGVDAGKGGVVEQMIGKDELRPGIVQEGRALPAAVHLEDAYGPSAPALCVDYLHLAKERLGIADDDTFDARSSKRGKLPEGRDELVPKPIVLRTPAHAAHPFLLVGQVTYPRHRTSLS